MTTTQLRRYVLKPGEADAFVEWWRSTIPELRARFGMAVSFAYLDTDANEFIWAVSAPGDRDEFARIERTYLDSPDRTAAFENLPERVASARVGLAERIW
jgi:hypothetical protein